VADRRSDLRGALHRGDATAVVAALDTAGLGDDTLELAGDGLLLAVAQHLNPGE
jgi:hypothetical protein